MADFVLGRLKFTFLGPWVTGTSYIKDDIITYGGIAYACTGNHTASGFFYTDIANWTKIAPGFNWRSDLPGGAWQANTQYNLNDIVRYGSDAYIVVNQHRSGNAHSWQANSANFQLFAGGLEFLNTYSNTVDYAIGDVVTFGGYTYIAIDYNINQQPNLNTSAWSVLTTGYTAVGTYNNSTKYEPGQVVNYGAYTYVNKVESTGILPSNAGYWTLVSKGTEYLGTYNSGTAYVAGDVVRFGGNTWVALTETTGTAPTTTNSSAWSTYTTGVNFRDSYDVTGVTQYNAGDVVRFGGNTYIAQTTSTNITPTSANSAQWKPFTTGVNYRSSYDTTGATQYYSGDLVRFGGNTYIATSSSKGVAPTVANSGQWNTFTTGTNFKSYYDTTGATQYNAGDIVRFGGNTYIALTTSLGVAPTIANAAQWDVYSTGYRQQGSWDSGTVYQLGDAVLYANSTYVSVATNNTNQTPANNPSYWSVMAQGSLDGVLTTPGDMLIQTGSGLQRLPIGANGQILVVGGGGLPQWENEGQTANVYYVCADTGNDIPTNGSSMQRPWKTIQYASQRLNAANNVGQTLATIMLRAGTYNEQLPITLPPGCSIVGDSTRTTIVQPAPGNDLTGSIPNANSTMFLLSDSTMLTHFTMKGMTGYVANNAVSNATYQAGSDISTHTIGGVFLRLNPSSPIQNKSPYINDMTAISTGGIGAVIDGSVHATGAKSMLFHSYTNINDNGVGFYVTNGGRIEAVSCFTYFGNFGYVANNGGVIRSLNGNNSYGKFGAVSTGSNPSESPITANVYGSMISYQANSVAQGIVMTSNNYIKGATSSATAQILSFQTTSNEIYIKKISGNFTNGETLNEYSDSGCTVATGVAVAAQTASAETGQSGFIVTLNNISANTALLPGASIEFVDGAGGAGHDPYAYVIASVATWSNAPNTAIVTLTSTKPNSYPTYDGQFIKVRQQFSNIRLTGHDFLAIGTGGIASTNYPNTSVTQYIPANQVVSNYPGRVYYVTTDQSGNFTVGQYFSVNQATGAATLNASSFNLSGLSSLRLGSIGAQLGAQINEFSTDPSLSQNSNTKVPTQQAIKTYVDDLHAATFEPTGFNRGTPSSMGVIEFSLDGTTIHKIDENSNYTTRSDSKFATGTAYETAASANTLAIYPAAGQTAITIWQSGIKYTFTSLQKSTVSGTIAGAVYFFVNNGALTYYTSMSGDYIQKQAFVALVYVNENTNSVVIFGDERHGITMDGATHYYLHTTSGTRYKSGLGVAGVTTGSTTFTSLATGEIWDEDIMHTIPSSSNAVMLYRSSNRWSKFAAANTFAYLSAGTAQYNQMTSPGVYTVSNIPTGKYAVMYIMATNDRISPFVRVMGQFVFDTLTLARESAQTEPRDTSTTGLPVTEFLWVGAVVVDYQGKVQTLDNGANYVDLRYVNISSGTNSSAAVQATAADTYFNNSLSGISTSDVQSAIDNLYAGPTAKDRAFTYFIGAM